MTGQQRRRQRYAFWTEDHLPLWLWRPAEVVGCALLGHVIDHDPNGPTRRHDSAWDICLWCNKSMPGQAQCETCLAVESPTPKEGER